jgi:hypothetical protein
MPKEMTEIHEALKAEEIKKIEHENKNNRRKMHTCKKKYY